MNGLAGPLHGLANQEVILWIMHMREQLGGGLPTKEQVAKFIRKTLEEGKVVPGYGHAVLRKTDPRFIAQQDFYSRYIKGAGKKDDLCEIVQMVYEVAPPILEGTGKIKTHGPMWTRIQAHCSCIMVLPSLIFTRCSLA
jgi:citrate synthase